jgi:Cu+-exporting ATPase
LWNKNNFSDKDNNNTFVDTLSKNFTIVVLSIATLALVYWAFKGNPAIGLNALTTVLIVACPCTLLLASTFAYGNMLRVLAKNKVYVRHASILEKINSVDTIVYDKTGTLTQANDVVLNYIGRELSEQEIIYIKSTAAHSKHVYSKSIVAYFDDTATIPVSDFKETIGKGIEAWVDEHYIKIGSSDFFNLANVHRQSLMYVAIDNEPVGHFIASNTYRKGFSTILKKLEKNYRQIILSGDNNSEQTFLEKTFGNSIQMHFNQKPEDKFKFIQQLQDNQHNVLMIGDGLNDAVALKESNVGVAITENNNNFTPACDIILDASFFKNFEKLFTFTRYGKRIIKISFAFSFIYNAIGLYFALQGILSPLVAAILMPMSSISIIVITFGLTQLYARKLEMERD